MTAHFRLVVDGESHLRFQTLAAYWSSIPAAQQTNIAAGALSFSQPSSLYVGSTEWHVQYKSDASKQVERLRTISKLWPRITADNQREIITHAKRAANLGANVQALAEVAAVVSRVSITKGAGSPRRFTGDDAKQWAADRGQLLGEIRAEYEGWCNLPTDDRVAIIAKLSNVTATTNED